MIAFCTTCKNRTGHLRRTLPQNLADNPKSKFIVLDYNSEDDLLDWLKEGMSQPIESGRLVVYSYRDHPRFRMAHSKNLAHRLGILEGADILLNLDADNFAGPRFEDFATKSFASNPHSFLWSHMIKGELTRGISGRIAVSASTFHKVGGYDEVKFAQWGPDDRDLNLRVQMAGYEAVEIPRMFLNSIPHNAKMRFKEWPELQSKEPHYFHMEKADIETTVVNGGKIGLGRVFRNFDESDVVEIKPLPTRIFGIGLHKTATTSLHHALGILGYDSWHWPNAHSAKAIWTQMSENGYSRTLERYHALCDLPIPLLYKELDTSYPGSKFILTVRDVDSWLEAVRRHYSYETNQFRGAWDTDPFTHRVHKLLYRTSKFHAGRMRNEFERHNAEVRAYFAARPDDLHVMDAGAGDPWGGLCKFLGVPRPTVPYPKAYVNGDR
jgi:Sulfotransferase domain/N-terminal domain of galactosyltransferase